MDKIGQCYLTNWTNEKKNWEMIEQQIRYIEPRDDARLLALKKRPKNT